MRDVQKPMRGWVVVNKRGTVQPGTLTYSKASAQEIHVAHYDVAEPYSTWGYWVCRGYAVVRCEVFKAPNHPRKWREGQKSKRRASTHQGKFDNQEADNG